MKKFVKLNDVKKNNDVYKKLRNEEMKETKGGAIFDPINEFPISMYSVAIYSLPD